MEERNFNLSPRKEGTREKIVSLVVRFELIAIEQHFKENITAIIDQFNVADKLLEEERIAESENIWRAQIVFLESALDFYLHELTKYGLSEIFSGNWKKTTKYDNLEVKMKIIEPALKAREDTDWFLEFVNNYYKSITMASYESVCEQLKLLGIDIKEVADKAFYVQGSTEKTEVKLKRRLNELFSRRNVIAHQSDRAHANAQKESITKEVVQEFISDINKIVKAINEKSICKV
jgi:hypothetical protein